MWLSTLLLLAAALAQASPPWGPPPNHGYGPRPGPTQHDRLGAVASESSICSDIGKSVLQDGGSAADTAVATVLCVGVIGMYHSGIGGGGFLLVRGSNGSYEFIDFRETAPAAAYERMYVQNYNGSVYGGLASGVPGELRGLAHLHQKYGRLPWKRLVLPAVNVARYGFPVTQDLVRYMASAVIGIPNFLVQDPTWAIDFAPNGTQLGLGDIITRKRYADTLESIAERGVDAFYQGPIAEATIKAIQSNNGTMTLADLENYTVAIQVPAEITYRNYTIRSTSAPSSGTVAMSVMKIIEGYPDIGQAATLNESTHLFDEALRFGYGQRAKLGDPLFLPNMTQYQAEMLSQATVNAVRANISFDHTLNTSAYDSAGFESLQTHGTSAVVTADASGMAVALTTTVNLLFGSHLMVPETGIILNNEMNDFSIPDISNTFGYLPSPANFIRPGKRPLSSICPTIVENKDGSLYFATSAAGGSRIITAVLQQLWHVLDQNMTSAQALAQPRLHDQLFPNLVNFEYAYNNETVAFMKARGHNVTWVAPGQSSAQSLRLLKNGTFETAAEPRLSNSGADTA